MITENQVKKMKTLVFLVMTAVCCLVEGKDKCMKACNRMLKPVCGDDGNTYPNPCMLSIATCKSGVRLAHDGPCKGCPRLCPMIYAPVCGTDGKTYGNLCQLNFAKCKSDGKIKLKHRGKCGCNQACTREYRPVCGSNGVTYGNPCGLEVASCNSDGRIKKAHDGPCRRQKRSPSSSKGCPTICTMIYAPVCGTDGKTYGNLCQLNIQKCLSDGKTQLDHPGKCGCSPICTKEYRPVCGTNGRTYGNPCTLEVASCTSDGRIGKAHDGPCGPQKRSPFFNTGCPKICPAIYAPVCGSDGVTYGNKCNFNAAKCKFGGDLDIAHPGKC